MPRELAVGPIRSGFLYEDLRIRKRNWVPIKDPEDTRKSGFHTELFLQKRAAANQDIRPTASALLATATLSELIVLRTRTEALAKARWS